MTTTPRRTLTVPTGIAPVVRVRSSEAAVAADRVGGVFLPTVGELIQARQGMQPVARARAQLPPAVPSCSSRSRP